MQKAKTYSATATVRFKKSVLEPQGKAIQLSLHENGLPNFESVRVGKIIELVFTASDLETAKKQIEKIASDMLYNDVMEVCEIEVHEI